MDCAFCIRFSHPFGIEAEVTHPAMHCSISVLASKEREAKQRGAESAGMGQQWGPEKCSDKRLSDDAAAVCVRTLLKALLSKHFPCHTS